VLEFEDYSKHVFVKYYLNLLDLSYIVRGCAQPKLTQANLNEIGVFNIPLSLQQQFADKIESIEKQKELIRKSIEEVEMLFNSRMDYYFG
jgi:type I restriction enzyme S subunit